MAVAISTLGTRILAQAAAVATAINSSPSTSTAEVQALAAFLALCGQRPAEFIQLIKLLPITQGKELLPQ